MIEGLGHVRLEVADLQQSVAFYRDGLRFRFERGDDSPPAQVHLCAGDLRLVLAQAPPRARARGAGVCLSLLVVSVDAYRDALVARGIAATAPRDRDGIRSFTVRDPDGYTWQFRQPRP